MKGFSYLQKVATLKLDQSLCIGCRRCREVCPHQVIVMAEKKAVITDLDACMECGACARNCPPGALTVDAGVGCASGIINEWLQEKGLRAPGGDCCS